MGLGDFSFANASGPLPVCSVLSESNERMTIQIIGERAPLDTQPLTKMWNREQAVKHGDELPLVHGFPRTANRCRLIYSLRKIGELSGVFRPSTRLARIRPPPVPDQVCLMTECLTAS